MEEDDNVVEQLGKVGTELERRKQAARDALYSQPQTPQKTGSSIAEKVLRVAMARPVLGGEGSDRFTSALGGVAEGATRSIAAVPQALEELGTGIYNVSTGSNVDATEQFNPVLDPIRQGIEFLGAKIGRGNEEYADEFQQKLGQGLGSVAGTIAGGGLGGIAAKAAGRSVNAGRVIGSVGSGMTSIGVEGVEDYRRTTQEQGGEFEGDKAFYTFLANAGVGITEAAPVLKAFNRLDRATGGTLDNVFGDILKGSVEEATQEAAQNIAGNLIASDLVGYDPERDAFIDTAESAALGGGVGAIMNTLMAVLGGQRRSIMLEEAGEPREPGLLEKALVTNGLSKTQTQADLENQLNEQNKQRKAQASINPRTGQEIQSKAVQDLNRGLQQAERFAENATTPEDIKLAEEAILDYRSKLEGLANKAAPEGGDLSASDVVAKQEARQLLSLESAPQEQPAPQDTSTVQPEIRTKSGNPFKTQSTAQQQLTRRGLTETHEIVPSDGGFILREKQAPLEAEETTEDPTTSIPEVQAEVLEDDSIDAINQAEAERLAAIAAENGINLPETETTGGIFTEGASTEEVAQSEDAIASNLWAEMTKDNPATDEQVELFRRNFPDWYATNVDAAVEVEPEAAQQLEVELPELTEDVATPDKTAEAIEQEAEQAAADADSIVGQEQPEPEVEVQPEEQVAVVEEPTEIPVEPAVAADPVVTQEMPAEPRPVAELFQAVQDGDISDYIDEITRDYGSLKNFENAVMSMDTPSIISPQQGLGVDEDIADAEGEVSSLLQEQAGFDPETDEGIEGVPPTQESVVDTREQAEIRELERKRAAQTLTARDRSSYTYATRIALTDEKLSNKNTVNFHYFNENGGLAELNSLYERLEAKVAAGEANSGALLAYSTSSVNDRLVKLFNKKSVSSSEVRSLLSEIERNKTNLNAFLDEAPSQTSETAVEVPSQPAEPVTISDIPSARKEIARLTSVRDALFADENAPDKAVDKAVKDLELAQDKLAELRAKDKTKTPTRKATEAKTEIHKTSQVAEINAQIEALEQQLDEASVEGRNTVRIERELEALNEKLNITNKQKEKASKLKKGQEKVATEKDLDKLADSYEEGTLDSETLDDYDAFPTLDDDGYISYMYAGVSAENAPITDAAKAWSMDARGESAQAIQKETGWHKNKDGMWRFEIDDSAVVINDNPSPLNNEGDLFALSDIMQHPTLFKHYPQLRTYKVKINSSIPPGTGWFMSGDRSITVGANTGRSEFTSLLLHETQHAVQGIEGFARGGSAGAIQERMEASIAFLEARATSTKEELSEYQGLGLKAFGEVTTSEKAVIRDNISTFLGKDSVDLFDANYIEMWVEWHTARLETLRESSRKLSLALSSGKDVLKRKTLDQDAFSYYRRLLGEIEARDTEARRYMSAEERRNSPPLISQGIPESSMTVRFSQSSDFAASLPAWATEKIIPTGEEVSKASVLPNGRLKYTHSSGMNAKISALVDRYRKNARKFGANVVAVDDIRQLPKHVIASLFSQYGQSTHFRGLFDSTSNTVYVMKNAHKNSKDLEITLMHELVGHFGFKNMFQATGFDTYENFLSRESARNPKLMKDAAAMIYGKGYTALFKTQRSPGDSQYIIDGQALYVSKEDNATILDEFIAFNTEKLLEDPQGFQSKYGSFRKRILAAIRHMFSKMGFVAKDLEVQDILSLIAESNTRFFDLKNQSAITKIMGSREGVRYSIAKYTDPESPFFDPRAADLSGVAPSGSFARQQGVAASLEANDTPFQKEVKDNSERKRNVDLMTVLNTIESGFGSATLNKWESTVKAAWGKVDNHPVVKYFRSFSALDDMPNKQAYRALNDLARGQVGRVEQKIKNATKAFKKMSPAQLEQAYKFFTTQNASPDIVEGLDASTKVMLRNAKQDIIDFGQTLVNMGLMSPEVYQSSKGMYLPKVYYKYLTDATPGGKRISFMSYLRKQADLSREDQVALGQIEDPSLVVPQTIGTIGRDITILQLTKNIVNFSAQKDLGWVLGESYKVKYVTDKGEARSASIYDLEVELERMKEQKAAANTIPAFRLTESDMASLDKRISYVSQLVQKAEQHRVDEINDMLKAQGLAEADITPEITEQYFAKNYKKIPHDYAYGALSGKYVMKSIYDDFVDSGRFDEDLREADTGKKVWRQAEIGHQYWKASKVVLNAPVSTVRNGIGNFILLDTSTNTNAAKLATMFMEELAAIVRKEPTKYQTWAKDSGLQGSTYASIELNQVMRNRMSQVERAIKLQTAKNQPWLVGGIYLRKGLGDMFALASEFYGAQEGIFKTVKLRDYIETWEKDNNTKMEDLDANQRQAVLLQAAQSANEAIFDYGEVPNWVRILRRTPLIGSPFVTFTYKSMLKMPENLAKHPQKFAKYMAVTSSTLMSALYAMFDTDWDEEEAEEVMNTLSDYYKESTAVFMYPWKDAQGRLQITDLTPFIPWSQHTGMLKGMYNVFERNNNAFDMVSGAASEAADWSGMMGTPLVSLILTSQGNIDPFTGREAIPSNLSGNEKMQEWAKYLFNLAMPPMYTEHGALGHLLDNAGLDVGPISSGRVLNSMGEDRESVTQAALRVAGVNVLPQNLNQNKRSLSLQHSAEIRDLRSRIGTISRDRNLDSISRAAKIREVQERIKLSNERYRERLSGD